MVKAPAAALSFDRYPRKRTAEFTKDQSLRRQLFYPCYVWLLTIVKTRVQGDICNFRGGSFE